MIQQYQASGRSAYDIPWPTDIKDFPGIAASLAGLDTFMAVCLRETGAFIGHVTLMKEGAGDTYDLGYIFNFDYHGQGFASEACRAVIANAFNQLHADKMTAGTALVNEPSLRLLARLGFVKTAESSVSFYTDPTGNPIEFRGASFELSRTDWETITSKTST